MCHTCLLMVSIPIFLAFHIFSHFYIGTSDDCTLAKISLLAKFQEKIDINLFAFVFFHAQIIALYFHCTTNIAVNTIKIRYFDTILSNLENVPTVYFYIRSIIP